MTHSIFGMGASDRQSVRQPSRQRRVMAASLLAGVVGTTGLAVAPANAVVAGTTFFAQEIFAPEGAATVAAPCGGTTTIADMAKPADLPAGTTASIVVIGPLTARTARDGSGCRVLTVGNVPVAVPASALVPKGLPSGTTGVVKVVAAARVTDTGTTKLVAEKVVNRFRTSTAPADVEVAYVADVTTVSTGLDAWTVKDTAGVPLNVDVTAAEIDDGLGSAVTLQFLTAPAPPD